jgi:ankyrin repeat protein
LRDNEGESPLLVACLRKNPITALVVLREMGADMQMKTRHNQTALHLVASSCSPGDLERATKLLIQNLVDPNDRDDDGKTMMHYINERKDINNNLKDTINSLFNTVPRLFSPRPKGSKFFINLLDIYDRL